MNNFKLLTKQL